MMKKSPVILIICCLSVFLSNCGAKDEDYIDPRGTDYAGAQSCIQCHQSIGHDALQTAHAKATAPASPETVMGNFEQRNVFEYDAHTKLIMEKRPDGLYQVLYKDGKEVKAYRFDIVFGHEHAQTSVYWQNNNTYELPISYYKSIDGWATSPGFSAEAPLFSRLIKKDCYACHASNASSSMVATRSDDTSFLTMDVEDVISSKAIVYGIDCERCHGPAKMHVDQHLKFPNLKKPYGIVSYKTLNNQQKLDACVVCHSGMDGIRIKSRFKFKPGDNLSDFYKPAPSVNGAVDYDVHGNQSGLLSQSKCFTQSQTMNCTTCHNAHQNASANSASYSKICLSCHNGIVHQQSPEINLDNCIDCHMPNQSSRAIKFQRSGEKEFSGYSLRNHRIAVYPVLGK